LPTREGPIDPAEVAFERYNLHVYRFLLKRTGDHYEAEELTQRVFADAAEALSGREDPPNSVLAWLYTVAERRFIDDVRRRVTARRAVAYLAKSSTAPDLTYNSDVVVALKETIAKLPEAQRVVVVRKVIHGESFAEIAADLEVTVDACKMRLSRAVATLREQLEERGVGPEPDA
jgi:RNA polymerase sigma-70 factor (ECF subfamily)